MKRIKFVLPLICFSTKLLFGQDSSLLSKAYFTIDSSLKPHTICLNNLEEPGYSYRWGLFHPSNIKETQQAFLETKPDFKSIGEKEKCVDLKDSFGTYWICLESTDWFNNKDTHCVKLITQFRFPDIPKVFIPGIDSLHGKTTYFDIRLEGVENYQLKIFDRWGMLIFESESEAFDWNGSIQNKGNPCPNGVYYYVLKYRYPESDIKSINGTVTLIR